MMPGNPSQHTIIDRASFYGDVCSKDLMKHPIILADAVEIDETPIGGNMEVE